MTLLQTAGTPGERGRVEQPVAPLNADSAPETNRLTVFYFGLSVLVMLMKKPPASVAGGEGH